ncbi:MAG: adenylate/guanylate cyclase domain-containing protein, partial [Coriobacteriia bacterium]|nr:adenylate/guanylate cyclase domain-containing protein [Coriobacteriia bacterium]
QHGGHGKSTGGDGLVAAFDSSSEAVRAAITMQRTLEEYNAAHASERKIVIRVGVATGEVVLDKGGRPFIGNALNLAARVMNLGDGGQVFTTRQVIDDANAPGILAHSHGEFELKNIAEPIQVMEVLWREGQQPSIPRVQSE